MKFCDALSYMVYCHLAIIFAPDKESSAAIYMYIIMYLRIFIHILQFHLICCQHLQITYNLLVSKNIMFYIFISFTDIIQNAHTMLRLLQNYKPWGLPYIFSPWRKLSLEVDQTITQKGWMEANISHKIMRGIYILL